MSAPQRTQQKCSMPKPMPATGQGTTTKTNMNSVNGSTRKDASADLFWIHCNSCFEMYTRKVKRVFLLSCHHLACESCAKEETNVKNTGNSATFKCPACGKIVRGRELGNNIPPQLKLLFHPKPWTDCVFSVQMFYFQLKQRNHYMTGFILPLYKFRKRLLEKHDYWRKRSKQTYDDLQTSKLDRKKLESRVRRVIEERKKQENVKKLKTSPATSPAIGDNSLKRRCQSQFLGMPKSAGRGYLLAPTRSVSSASNSFVSSFNNGFSSEQKYFRL